MKEELLKLKARLDKMKWPAIYPFKFIVPLNKLNEVLELFEKNETETKVSRNGNYVSVTAKPLMYSSDHVIEKYEQAAKIEGIMSL